MLDPNVIQAMLEALQCGAALIDPSGRIVYVNAHVCEMMSRSREDIISQSLLDFYPDGDGRDVIDNALNRFDEEREYEFHLPRSDGTHLPVLIYSRRLIDHALAGEFRLVTLMDLSKMKHAERDLQQRYRDIAALSDTVLEQALQLKQYSKELEQRVRERTAELHTANMESIQMLAVASEVNDLDTGAHVRRIEHYSRLLAREIGLSDAQADRIGYSAILHDVGKIHVPGEILRKPGPLSDEQWEIMRQHTLVGERILSREPFFDLARSIARSHHENWDGTGYPDGLRGSGIPMAARIVRVADVFDALTSARPYKIAWSPTAAAEAIEKAGGFQFDPELVTAFTRVFREGRWVAPDGCETTS